MPSIKDLDVFTRVCGEGFPVVMLHGMTGDHKSMFATFEPIFASRPGWQRLYFDLPGMGQTKGADWITGSDHMLEVVIGVVEALIPDQRFLVIGESYGGYLARGLVYYKPDLVDGLFLMCPTVRPRDPNRQLPEKRVVFSDPEAVSALASEMQEALSNVATVHSRDVIDRIQADYMPAYLSCDMAFLQRVHEHYVFSFDLNNPAQRHEFPALIITGRQDTIVGYADQLELHRFYPRGTLAVLDRVGHVAELEQPRLFPALTHEWLDRVEEAQRLSASAVQMNLS